MKPEPRYRNDMWHWVTTGESNVWVNYPTTAISRPLSSDVVYVIEDMKTGLWLVVGATGDPEIYRDRDTARAAAMHR